MPNADNFSSSPRGQSAPTRHRAKSPQVENLVTWIPYIDLTRMAPRTSYARRPSLRAGVHGGAIGEIAASNSTMYGWPRPSISVMRWRCGAIGEVTASNDSAIVKPWRSRLLSLFSGAGVSTPRRNPAELDTFGLPPHRLPGVAGMPGLTPGSACSDRKRLTQTFDVCSFRGSRPGAVESVVCQIAKLNGPRQGSAGVY